MYHLRLTKALSYSGIVTATRKHPDVYTEDEATANAAVATGYFRLVSGAEDKLRGLLAKAKEAAQAAQEQEEQQPDGEAPDYEELAKLKKAELIAYAEEHGIDLTGCSTKDEILAAISVAYGGSYTMIDLQKQE